MKLKVKKDVPLDLEEVEITLPLYRKHDVSGDTYISIYYTKIFLLDDGFVVRQIDIKYDQSYDKIEWSLSMNIFKEDSRNSRDYILGLNKYKLDESEWNEIKRKYLQFVNRWTQ